MVQHLIPPRRFDRQILEMMDRPESDPEVLRDDLKNLRVINRYFGGLRSLRKHILPLLERADHAQQIRILDLATGSADHPVELVRLARMLECNLRITAVDKNPLMVAIARECTRTIPEIKIEEADILRLPFHPQSFDIVLCSLVIHHLARESAVELLRNIHRIARVGWIVQDLNRSWPAAWTAWIYTHLTTRNPMTLHDSYLSVLRAFTPAELSSMARDAGLKDFHVVREPFFRLVVTGRAS